MKRPKALYRYSNCGVDKHVPGTQCVPQIVEQNEYGTLWRCRSGVHDRYGYDKLKSAKAEEIVATRARIGNEHVWLARLTKSK